MKVKQVHDWGSEVKTIAYSPDGKTIAVGGWDKRVVILDSKLDVIKEDELED
eukprot:CAMPEP_0198261254 /NCGR_PEP_ID=MMETSP1447-20131203/10011_1 /TAXON_ID=420782 /ORGANISM="Chaetoceros dichaeta, Strain CCMP1751" /LENGTH=51 /DNA_ID=CAMNT_0043949107 /DNA_START=33 /DNA_END=185 /DNA_ORIENTATION=-